MQTPSRFPLRMRQKPRWIGWVWGMKEPNGRWVSFDLDTLEPHDGHLWHRRADGTLERASKLPLNVRTLRAASVSAPSTWSTFETALNALRRETVHGLGYVLDAGEILIDVDGCMKDGELNDFARALVSKLDSYSEFSVSSEGVHIVCVADGFTPDRGQKGARIECYVGGFTNRFCTVSGNVLQGYETLDDDAADVLADIYQSEFADRPVISEEARAASEKFLREARLIELSQDDERAVAWMCGHFKHARAMFGGAANYLGWAQDRQKYNAIDNGDSSELASGADDGRKARDASRSAADFALASYLLTATEGDGDRALALLLKSGMARPKYYEVHDGRNPYALMTVASVLKHVDVELMRQRAFERRDKQLDNLLERRQDMRPLDDLMRRDDVTPAMLTHVMAYHATGAVRQDPHTWLCNYPRAFVPWAIERWPSIVTLAYRYDLGLGEVIHE